MKYQYYPEIIADNDIYETDPQRRKVFINSSVTFYLNLFKIVFYSYIKTKRNIYDRYNWTASSLDIIHSLERAGVKFKITGMNNLKKFDGPAVIISNHMSTLETMSLPAIIQPIKQVVYVIKKELTTYPLFGAVAKARYPITVGRENPREDLKIVLEEGMQRLNNGKSVIIFPQKTRTLFFEPKSFNTLGVKLAKKAGVYVLPFAILSDAWGNGEHFKDFGKINSKKKVYIALGEPFKVESNGTVEHERVLSFIKENLIEWGREDLIREN